MIKRIYEGMTGQNAADTIYNNDSFILGAIEYPEDITDWATPRGFYDLNIPTLSGGFVANNNYDNQVIPVTEGDAFKFSAGLGPSTQSVAMVTLYFQGNLAGFAYRGLAAGTPPQILTDEIFRVPQNVDTIVITSQTAYPRKIERLTLENLGGKINDLNDKVDDLENQVNNIRSGENYPPRVNAGESTIAPEIYPANGESANVFAISIVPDTASPFRSALPYKRVFSKTTGASSVYNATNLPAGTNGNRPTSITVAYWMKVDDILHLWPSTMQLYFGLTAFNYNINNLLNNPGTKQTVNKKGDFTEYTQATLEARVGVIKDGYALIIQHFKNIVWKPDYMGSTVVYYFIFNGVSNFINYPTDIYNLTVLHNQDYVASVDVYPAPDGAYGQVPTTLGNLQQQINDLNDKVDDLTPSSGSCRYLLLNGSFYFASPFNETQDLVRVFAVNRPGNSAGNSNINITSTKLIPKGSNDLTGGTLVKSSGDDITPANVNGSYAGGNHGWRFARRLTLNSHGKTVADVGSIYQDSAGVNFTILRVEDANNLIICSQNLAGNGWSYDFTNPSGVLTYVSNGTNTAAISGYTTEAISNLYSTLRQNVRLIRIDGVKNAVEGIVSPCEYVDLIDDYDMLDLPDVLNKLTSGRPGGGYTTNPDLSLLPADPLFNHNITYRLLSNGTTLIFHNFRTFKKLDFNFHGFIQSEALPGASAKLYIPKTLPINDGVTTWDLANIINWNSAPGTALHLTPDRWAEPTSPPDRWLNYNDTIALHLGYLSDRGLGLLRKSNPNEWLSNAGFANTSLKLYPFAANKGGEPIEANTFLSIVAFRQWLNKNNNPTARTNFSHFDINGEAFIFLDYHGAIEDAVDIPAAYQGRKIEVLEKSNNVNILNDVATNLLSVSVNDNSTYGYAVLKLK